ncbi:MAG: ATP-binding protein, partial [Chloroflexota bacterium]
LENLQLPPGVKLPTDWLSFDEQSADAFIDQMTQERQRLQQETASLEQQLKGVTEQLNALGIESGSAGLAQVVKQLYEQKTMLHARSETLQIERDALLDERRRFEQRIRKEQERETQIETMESEIRHLATDREAITKQRDAARQERSEMEAKVNKIKEQRARLLADISVYEDDVHQLQDQLQTLQDQLSDTTNNNIELSSSYDQLRAEHRTVLGERDQLIARAEGDRGRLQELSANANEEVREILREITNQRDQLLIQIGELRDQQQKIPATVTSPVNTDQDSTTANPELLMSMVDSLRTPMTSIVGYVDLLVSESAGLLSEMQRSFIQRISSNTSRLDTMLNDLIHITALDTGRYQLETQPSDLIEIIEDAITQATYQFREKDLTVQIRLDDNVPEIEIDPEGIQQVIGQLLTNACLVSPAESTVGVATFNTADDTGIVVAIRDSGGGIPEDEQDEVFARRYRTEHHLITGLGDTGVGLSIAKAIVEAHNGEMWFESAPNNGTTFYIQLPYVTLNEGTPNT